MREKSRCRPPLPPPRSRAPLLNGRTRPDILVSHNTVRRGVGRRYPRAPKEHQKELPDTAETESRGLITFNRREVVFLLHPPFQLIPSTGNTFSPIQRLVICQLLSHAAWTHRPHVSQNTNDCHRRTNHTIVMMTIVVFVCVMELFSPSVVIKQQLVCANSGDPTRAKPEIQLIYD